MNGNIGADHIRGLYPLAPPIIPPLALLAPLPPLLPLPPRAGAGTGGIWELGTGGILTSRG